jgi:hypothetical protein
MLSGNRKRSARWNAPSFSSRALTRRACVSAHVTSAVFYTFRIFRCTRLIDCPAVLCHCRKALVCSHVSCRAGFYSSNAWDTGYRGWGRHGFPQSLGASTEVRPRLGCNRSLPNPDPDSKLCLPHSSRNVEALSLTNFGYETFRIIDTKCKLISQDF